MELFYLEKVVIVVAGICGLIQGTTWMILSLISIVLYNIERADQPINHYSDVFQTQIYNRFLNAKHPYELRSDIVTPRAFTIFMWLYFLSDFMWIVTSVALLISHRLKSENVLKSIKAWMLVSGIALFLDLSLTIFLGLDYDNCLKLGEEILGKSTIIEVEHFCTDTIIPIVVISSKGFILWIIDVLIVFILAKIITSLQKRTKDANNTTRLPRVSIQNNPNNALMGQLSTPVPARASATSPTSAQYGGYFAFPPVTSAPQNRGKTWGADRTQVTNPSYDSNRY